jgi:thiol-disulfide isomerase/thioredoxin
MTNPDPASRTSNDALAATWSAARRRWLFASVAGAAAAAGVGLWWWQARPGDTAFTATNPFWDMVFPTPGGGTLAMRSLMGKPLLLNFWATWCPPCIEEMPLLDRFHAANRANGWQVLGMAVDQGAAVERFLARTPVGFAITLAGMSGVELSRSMGNPAGGLPFTVVFDGAGRIVQRKIGQVNAQDLQQWSALH